MTIALQLTETPEAHQGLETLIRDRVASRIFAHDSTLWGADAAAEAAVRLGWTDLSGVDALLDEVEQLRSDLRDRGVDRVVLCGMGGSSLAPAVIARWAGVDLRTIDSTHPDVVRDALAGDLARTVVVVSSKSGGTIETLSHRAAFTTAFDAAGLDASAHIVVVTDPGSPLEADARAAGQRVFLADPNVGGRFSALTAFGLVPTALAGADVRALVADAAAARDALRDDAPENPALRLAAWVADGLPRAYVLGVCSAPGAQWDLGSWIEQLIAESTGKDGQGVLPIALADDAPEVRRTPANTRLIRIFGSADVSDATEPQLPAVGAPLGAQLLLWEVTTAVLGRLMGIDPFNQPDVEAAKVAAREQLAQSASRDVVATPVPELPGVDLLDGAPGVAAVTGIASLVTVVRGLVEPGGYLAIQAYLDPDGPSAAAVLDLRDALAERLGAPVALGWGPRYLHSTGQLHKGGPALGGFLQLCDAGSAPLDIPGSEAGFETLITAQAAGDRSVLRDRGRPVLAIRATDPGATACALIAALASSD